MERHFSLYFVRSVSDHCLLTKSLMLGDLTDVTLADEDGYSVLVDDNVGAFMMDEVCSKF